MIDEYLLSQFAPPESKSSFFISFEGIEGSGKTTQIQILSQALTKRGYAVEVFREPGGTPFGEKLREAILTSGEKVAPLAEACLFAASRAQLLEKKILPALETPKTIVVVDRYLDSSLAYQGGARGLGAETVLRLHQNSPLNTLPNLSFYLRIDLETSMQRQAARGSEKDYFESENATFYKRLIQGYDSAAQLFPRRIQVIDGAQNEKSVAAQIMSAMEERLLQKGEA